MNKKEKIEYINNVYNKFENAKNHGTNGSGWWYPTSFTIAYNVKMYSFADVESLRDNMSPLQNEYYNDDSLCECINTELEYTGESLIEDIQEQYGLQALYAGRSGGWLEVDYNNIVDIDYVDDDMSYDDVNFYLLEAKRLEKIENNVSNFIKKRHTEYNDYVDTGAYYRYICDNYILPDNEIKEIYKYKIKKLSKIVE